MRLGISSYTYTWAIGVAGHEPESPMNAIRLLRAAAELGVSVVQVADNLPLDRLGAPELEEFRAEARSLGIDVEVGTRGISAAHLRAYLDLARRLDSRVLRIVIDTAACRPTEDEVVSTLAPQLPEFERNGIVLAIENHDRFRAREFARIVERLGASIVGICLDTVNSFGALEGPEVVVETLGPYVLNLHVKDFTIHRASHMMGFSIEGRPAGEGRLDVPWLLDRLARLGRDPNAVLEVWTPPAGDLRATIEREAEWARRSVRYLRTLIPG
jgi:3-oxoisoapionate decarboxylase